MAEHILMTALSPTMEQGTILKWNVAEQDTITSGDVLCEVETDKASMDYESAQEGTLLKIIIPEGGMAQVGKPIAIIGDKGDDIGSLVAEAEKSLSQTGDGLGLAAPQSTPPSSAPPVPSPSTTPAPASPSHTTASPPQPIAAPPSPSAHASSDHAPRVKSSPLARKIARDKGLSIGHINGSGPGGRVIARDVQNATPSPATPSVSTMPLEDTIVPLTTIRSVIATRLVESKFTAPHFYLSVSIDMTETLAARALLNKRRDPRVSLNAFLIKFVAEAIRRTPAINSSWGGDHIRQFASVDIGLAVDAGKGLTTPIVKNCLGKGVLAIEQELVALIDKARSNSLKPEDYQGATFSISNLGSFGIDEFTGIINPPGAAILAIGRTTKTPVVIDNEVVIRPIMKVTLSCDHRVIDGALAAHFLSGLKTLMENPASLIY